MRIQTGATDIVIAGGVESMNNVQARQMNTARNRE
jgi:acetyl-CoA acetyltransferase